MLPPGLASAYFSTNKGRFARFAVFASVLALLLHFFSGPPPLRELSVAEGIVESVRVEGSFQGSSAIWLTIRTPGQGAVEAQYFANKGDDRGLALRALERQRVKIWFEQSSPNTIYQIERDGTHVIDYDVRRNQLVGRPTAILAYVSVAWILFALISVSLVKELSGAKQA